MYSEALKSVSMSKSQTFNMVRLFEALADRTRLRILNLMGGDEVCVCFFVEVLDEGQPKISRHLAYLRRAGLVSPRREGKWMHYRIAVPSDPHASKVLQDVMDWVKEDKEMKQDRVRLVKVCCMAAPPVQIQGAPKPASIAANSSR
jgi:ArsR family transcriptional regulator, arsenate/arsenite/antimonite-responsive transcriptional repressor